MSSIKMCAAILAASSLVAVVSVASAANAPSPIDVKGTQTIVDEKKGKYAMQGDLLGTWNVTAFTPHYQGLGGRFVGSGKELFSGCRDADRSGACDAGEPKGTIRFSFVYWATYNPKTQALVRGECVHPVLGGTGAFAGVKGVIHMKDVPVKNGVRTTYTGQLAYPGAAGASTRAPATRELSARAVRGGCGS